MTTPAHPLAACQQCPRYLLALLYGACVSTPKETPVRHNTIRDCTPACWYVAKRRGRRHRMRNRCTGAWDRWDIETYPPATTGPTCTVDSDCPGCMCPSGHPPCGHCVEHLGEQ